MNPRFPKNKKIQLEPRLEHHQFSTNKYLELVGGFEYKGKTYALKDLPRYIKKYWNNWGWQAKRMYTPDLDNGYYSIDHVMEWSETVQGDDFWEYIDDLVQIKLVDK